MPPRDPGVRMPGPRLVTEAWCASQGASQRKFAASSTLPLPV